MHENQAGHEQAIGIIYGRERLERMPPGFGALGSEIPNGVDRLEKAVAGLTEVVAHLEARLEPALLPQPPEPTTGGSTSDCRSPLGRNLHQLARDFDALIDRLQGVAQRLAL